MANKVIVCGMDTSTLPKISNTDNMKLLQNVRKQVAGAKQEFIYNNMRLVLSIVQRFKLQEALIDDIFQVGIIGLIKAMNGFNTDINVQFSTYAVPMIIGEIKRFMRDRTSIRVTRSMRDLAYQALQAKEQLNKRGKEGTIEEIADELSINSKAIKVALDAISEPVSIFETVYEGKDGSIKLIDQLEDNHKYEDNWIENTELEKGLEKLTTREKEILKLRYYIGKTQIEISEEIGISQAQVSRLEKNALESLRESI